MRSPSRGLGWIVGGVIALIAAVIAVAIALGFFVFALLTAIVVTLRALFAGGGRVVRATDPGLIEARRIGGHSWVAYGWDGRR